MYRRTTIAPIYSVCASWEDEPFSLPLPFPITSEIALEDISTSVTEDLFAYGREDLSPKQLAKLTNIKYALVHSYTNKSLQRVELDDQSIENVHILSACLGLLRPMRRTALPFQYMTDPEGRRWLSHLQYPINLMETLEQHKLFCVRNQDIMDLQRLGPKMLDAYRLPSVQFKIAVQFFEEGHLFDRFWKGRFLMWMVGLDSLFTTPNREHRGTRVVWARIAHLLGKDLLMYTDGKMDTFTKPDIRLREILEDVYRLRHYVVHGSQTPDSYFKREGRPAIRGNLTWAEMLMECTNTILRRSLLAVLELDRIDIFASQASKEAYYVKLGLVASKIEQARSKGKSPIEFGDDLR